MKIQHRTNIQMYIYIYDANTHATYILIRKKEKGNNNTTIIKQSNQPKDKTNTDNAQHTCLQNKATQT